MNSGTMKSSGIASMESSRSGSSRTGEETSTSFPISSGITGSRTVGNEYGYGWLITFQNG